jgi:hypothetical protein
LIHGLPEINSVACIYESTLTYRCGGSIGIVVTLTYFPVSMFS